MSVVTVTTQRVVAVDGVVVRRLITVGTQGPPGVITATPPITYDAPTQTVGFDGSLSDLNDVDTAGVATDDLLAFDGTEFVPTSEPTVDGLLFDLTAGLEATTEGELVWDDDAGTIDLGMNDGVIQKVGEDQFYRVQAAEAIAFGDLVMAVGTVGNSGVILAAKSRPVYDGNPMDSQRLMGLAAGAIPQGERGYVLSFGQLRKINTLKTGWLEGTILWANPSVPGGLTPTRPAAPAWKTIVALVVTRSAQVGALQVRPTFGSSLANDELVDLNGVADGDVLQFDGVVGAFKAVALTAVDVGADPAGTAASAVSTHNSDTTSVHGIADTSALVVGPATATSGRVAVYNGTTGKLLQDGTKAEADLVVGPATSIDGRLALFDSTTGKLLKQGTLTEAQINSLVIGAFTWDSATTSPGSSVTRTVPQFVLSNLYDQIRGCVLNANGTVNYYLNPTDWSLKATGGASVLTGADGNVMVEIPKFYYRVSRSGTETTWEVSPIELSGFAVHPAFIKDGVEVPFRYYGAYDASVFRVAEAITGATAANPVVITSTNHGLLTGNTVTITGVVGMTELNGRTFTITRVDGDTYSLDGEDGTTHTPYTSGGTWSGHINGLNWENNSTAGVDVDTTASTGDKLASVSGVYPMVGLTRGEFRTLGANVGSGWRQLDFHLWQAVGLLYLVEYQTFYNQDELGAGNTNSNYSIGSSGNQSDSPHTIAGAGNSWANGSTDGSQPSTGAKPGTAYMRYRGIENLFGNCWNWADGININVTSTGNVHVTNNAANWADNTATNYTLISSSLTTASGNIASLLSVDPWFLAATTGGTSAQYVTDRHFGSASANRVAFVSNSAGDGGSAGVFSLAATIVSSARSRNFGGRLCR